MTEIPLKGNPLSARALTWLYDLSKGPLRVSIIEPKIVDRLTRGGLAQIAGEYLKITDAGIAAQ